MIRKTHWSVWVLAFVTIWVIGYLRSKKEEKAREERKKELIWEPPPNDGKMYRGWDWDKKEWKEDKSYNYHYNQHLYTEEELQQLREELEYDTKGKPEKRILTKEEEIQETIDNYVEDNIDDIMDDYGN